MGRLHNSNMENPKNQKKIPSIQRPVISQTLAPDQNVHFPNVASFFCSRSFDKNQPKNVGPKRRANNGWFNWNWTFTIFL